MLPIRKKPRSSDANGDMTEQYAGYAGLSEETLNNWRTDQTAWQQWRWDAQIEEQYKDGNQFSEEDRQALAASGIPMITINRTQHQINSVVGLQRTNLTDLKLNSEDVQAQDATDAMNVKLHEYERTSKLIDARMAAAKTAATIGIGWIEIARNTDPFRPIVKAAEVPWREMSWDWRNGIDIADWEYTRRVKAYPIERLQARFKDKQQEIIDAGWNQSNLLQWIDVDQQYREYQGRNWRDVPLTWNWSGESQRRFRLLEEVFYQVQVEGVVVRLPSGRVIAYDDCGCNPMVQLAIKTGNAQLEEATYGRWRRSYWINNTRLSDEWSPMPFNENPYTPIWCYREEQTGVPYGLIRIMRSIQDAINTLEAKMMFSINAKQVEFEEGAIDVATWQQQVGRKNGFLPVKPGFIDKVRVNDHIALNEQHFKLYQDLLVQIETVGGTAGLNPGALGQRPRSGVLAQQMMQQAMSSLGEFQSNCHAAAVRCGWQLLEFVREDIQKKGNVTVEVRDAGGRKKMVKLHQHTVKHVHDGDEYQIVDNDVTLLNMQMAMEETPHTATYRAGQLDNLAMALQSLPANDPALEKVRVMLTSLMLKCMDIPGAVEMSQMILEALGLSPPSTPEEQAQAQAAAQKQAQVEQLQMQGAQAKIGRDQAAAQKDMAAAEHHRALAQAEAQPDPVAEAERRVALDKQAQQVDQIRAKTAHTDALTELTRHKTTGQAIGNAKDAQEPPPASPPPSW